MLTAETLTLSAPGVRSLVWQGDTLVDWLNGGQRHHLNGQITPGTLELPAHIDLSGLDWVITSPDGLYQALLPRRGTQGVLLKAGEYKRDLRRAEYVADAYEYPLTLGKLFDGRSVMIHCPNEYNRLEIEDLETGEALAPYDGESLDYFQSRLQLSPDGRRLLTMGWHWQPFEGCALYDVARGLKEPAHFQSYEDDLYGLVHGEPTGGTFLDDQRLALATFPNGVEVFDPEGHPRALGLGELGVFAIQTRTWLSRVRLREPLGTLHRLGPWLLSLYDYPKLVNPYTGAISIRWFELNSGQQAGSILLGDVVLPTLAIDEARQRFALANDDSIHVVQLREEAKV